MSEQSFKPADQHGPRTYEIRLAGHLDARWATRLDVQSLSHGNDGTTLMRSFAADQSALHGLLHKLRDLGLPLISIVQMDADQPSLPATQGEKK